MREASEYKDIIDKTHSLAIQQLQFGEVPCMLVTCEDLEDMVCIKLSFDPKNKEGTVIEATGKLIENSLIPRVMSEISVEDVISRVVTSTRYGIQKYRIRDALNREINYKYFCSSVAMTFFINYLGRSRCRKDKNKQGTDYIAEIWSSWDVIWRDSWDRLDCER